MPSWSERPRTHQVACEECSQPGQMCQTLDPHTWRPSHRRLCRKHREQHGFHIVDYGRGHYSADRAPGA